MKDLILEKIQKVKDYFHKNKGESSDLEVIENWIDVTKRLILIDHLAQHDGMKYVRNIFETEVEKINSTLTNSYSKDLSDIERDRLLDRRELAKQYLDLFSNNDVELEKIEETVDSELSRVE